ncbi:MAG: ECF-type sigma factor [Planctomycetota bacterium]
MDSEEHPQSGFDLAELYPMLRRIASDRMRRERASHTLNATAVVHEAWIRLRGVDRLGEGDRNHFLSIAASTIRRVLVDHARARNAEKRGGGDGAVGLLTSVEGETQQIVEVIALHESLERLSKVDTDCARLVELRFFGGLTIDETADAMGIGRSSAVRLWRGARAWLKRDLGAAGSE